jgi:hypothetical protein
MMHTKDDLLLGGPGLDGYAYQADVYCVPCGQAIIRDLPKDAFDELETGDTEVVPVPILFGGSDIAEHCGDCGEYLYGGEGD